jgi:protein ImuB
MDAFAIEVPDGAPANFHWRRMRHRVVKSEGPERLAMEWWLDGKDTQPRDYFRVEDDQGHRFWIYRKGLYGQDETQSWYMHGMFA